MDFLVARGYDENTVVNEYSVRKINALFEAALKNMKIENKQLGQAVRIGFNADGSDFSRWMKEE